MTNEHEPFEIIGVHPINAPEPCHLIEVELCSAKDDFDFGSITQEVVDRPRENWQAAYDEELLSKHGGRSRYVFFFHYLDFSKPLITSLGRIYLPRESPLPDHLDSVVYEPP